MRFTIKFGRGIVQDLGLCGPENEPLVDRNYWTFETRDVTPPEISFILSPSVSNENITISWGSNENVTWECALTYGLVESAVNCSDALWIENGLQGGSYVLSVQARDEAGNVATRTHSFEVDVTPPITTFTVMPSSVSNANSFTLSFTCNEVCSYQCFFVSNMSVPSHSLCNNGRFSTPSLSPDTNYTLTVVATDQLGNIAESVSYSWITDFEAPIINVSQTFTTSCGFTDPEHTGQAQAVDNRPESVSITYRDAQSECTIRRTWMATDLAGNTAQQIQDISIDFSPTISLSSTLNLPCDSTLSSQEVSRSTAMAPNPCRLPLQLSFEDSISTYACPDTFVRNWTVNSCGTGSSELQTIHLYDVCPPQACGRNETIPRGTCSLGQCYCNRPWYGDDCSVLILQPIALPVNDDTLQEAQEYSTMISLSQGTAPISWILESGPSLLQVDQYTGQVTWRRAQAGNHSISVLARNEIGETRVDWTLQVIPGYTARINPVSPTMYPYAQPVTITGSVDYAMNNTVEGVLGGIVPVQINITSNGATRTITAYTTTNGTFSQTFYPAPTEYGTYVVTASHPGSMLTLSQAEWSVLGMRATPPSIDLMAETFGGQLDTTFSNVTFIYNNGPGPLSGLSATPRIPGASGISIYTSLRGSSSNDTIQPGEQLAMDLRVVTSRIVRGSFIVAIEAAEGTSLQLLVSLQIRVILPRLQVSPSRLSTRIVRGTSRPFEFNITNVGRNVATNVRAVLPNSRFVSLVSFGNMQQSGSSLSLAAGESATLAVLTHASASQQFGVIDLSLVIRSDQVSSPISISLTVSSDLLMNLTVIVQDEYTFFADSRPLVDNAVITLINYQRNIRARMTTAEGNGTATFFNIHEDRYEMYIEAPGHRSLHQVIITSIDTPVITMFIQRQAVRYTWNVRPVVYEDVYVIPVVAEFETHVPIPVVTVDPTEVDLAELEAGNISSIQINITNHGLVRADNVTIALPSHPSLEFSTSNEELGNLEALSSVIVTVRSSRRAVQKRARVVRYAIYTISVVYSYVCNVPIYQNISILLKWIFIIIEEIATAIGQLVEHREMERTRPPPTLSVNPIGFVEIDSPFIEGLYARDAFTGVEASTSILCDECFTSLFMCIDPLPNPLNNIVPLAGCIPLIDSGTSPLSSVENALMWLECTVDNDWARLFLCLHIEDVFEKCLTLVDNLTSRSKRNADRVLDDIVEALYPIQQSMALGTEVLGDDRWITTVGDDQWLSNTLRPTLDDNSEAGVLISTTELAAILAAAPPNGTTIAMIAQMVERVNNTISGWNNGLLEPVDGVNMASFSAVEEFAQNINRSNQNAIGRGFTSYLDEYNFVSGQVNAVSNLEDEAGVCAVVRIRIVQELALTREAFQATLEIENEESSPLQDINVEITIVDTVSGAMATHLFSIGNETLSDSFVIASNGIMLASDASGTIDWLIIPYSEAAPVSDHIYSVGGSFMYTVGGENITVPLLPTLITVRPDPSLLVHYFLERYVQGDDPLTDATEPSAPFTLGVAVRNAGYGTAHALRLTSSQPEIIDNERGLLITFMIIGARMGNQGINPSLTVTFGDLEPNTTTVLRWYMLSSSMGEFTSYSATFENRNPLGDPRLSLLDELETHELVRNVMMYNSEEDDGILDFLVNDQNDLLEYPDGLYSSRTLEQHNVSVGTVESVHTISDNTTTSILVRTSSNMTGWVYYRYEDSQGTLMQTAPSLNATKTVANQTVSIPPENVWITSDQGSENETGTHYLHILDHTLASDVRYNVELCSVDCTPVEVPRQLPTPAVSILAPGDVVYADVDTSLSLNCSIEVDSDSVTVAVIWLQGDTQIVNGSDRVSVETNSEPPFTSILTVYPVNSNDSDNFTCRAMIVPTDDFQLVTASDTDEDTVLVIVEDTITTPPPPTTVTENVTESENTTQSQQTETTTPPPSLTTVTENVTQSEDTTQQQTDTTTLPPTLTTVTENATESEDTTQQQTDTTTLPPPLTTVTENVTESEDTTQSQATDTTTLPPPLTENVTESEDTTQLHQTDTTTLTPPLTTVTDVTKSEDTTQLQTMDVTRPGVETMSPQTTENVTDSATRADIFTVIVPSAVGAGAALILIVLIIIATACLCTRCKRGKRKNHLETYVFVNKDAFSLKSKDGPVDEGPHFEGDDSQNVGEYSFNL